MDDGEHSPWHAKTSKKIRQKGSADGAIGFGEVDKAQAQGGVLLPRQSVMACCCENRISCWSLGSRPILFILHSVLAFAAVTKATRDALVNGIFAGFSNEEDAIIGATLRPTIPRLDRCTFLLLRHATSRLLCYDALVDRSYLWRLRRASGASTGSVVIRRHACSSVNRNKQSLLETSPTARHVFLLYLSVSLSSSWVHPPCWGANDIDPGLQQCSGV